MNISKITILFLIIFSTTIFSTEVDPFQEINEKTHNFNLVLDKQLATPVARIYKKVTPDVVEKSITNFTHNIEDLSIAINNILQGKINNGISDLLRFTINSSLGVLGFFDVASNLGFEKHDEDFGQTLATWGMGAGPYIVLPGLGPSNLRDTLSMLPDAFLTPLYIIDHDRTSYSLTAIDIVETRARYLGLESVVIGDDYLFYRDAYLQSREFDILDGEVSEEFDEFDDFD